MSAIEIEDTRNADAIANSPDWKTAVEDLLALWAEAGRCYSSGEVTAVLRVHRSDFAFRTTILGSYLRDLFYGDTLPQYGNGNGPCSPVQRSRFTVGLYPDRTEPGVEVFVYGPNTDACDAHEFEIFVPRWDQGRMETMADAPPPSLTTTSAASAPGTLAHANAQAAYTKNVVIAGAASKLKADDYVASVRTETRQEPRMHLGRGIFEALCHMSGTSIRAGQPVFVQVETDSNVIVTLTDPGIGAKACNISSEKGCVLFSSGDKANPFPCGKYYKVTVSPTEITVDLSQAV